MVPRKTPQGHTFTLKNTMNKQPIERKKGKGVKMPLFYLVIFYFFIFHACWSEYIGILKRISCEATYRVHLPVNFVLNSTAFISRTYIRN